MKNRDQLITQLPHQPPMRMIHAVLEASSERSVCLARVDQDLLRLWGDGAGVASYVGIEMVAQTAAIGLGIEGEGSRPLSGALVQVSHYEAVAATIAAGEELKVEAEIDQGLDGRYAVVRGQIRCGSGELIGVAKLSIAIDR